MKIVALSVREYKCAPSILILHVHNLLRATLSTMDERTGDQVRYYVGHFDLQEILALSCIEKSALRNTLK